MNTSFINEQAWLTFQQKYPDAYGFLLERALVGEFALLNKRGNILNDYEWQRYKELYHLLCSTEELKP